VIANRLLGIVQSLVDIVKHGLEDENQKVKTITALTIAALAEAAAPYGIESFDDVLKPLWTQIRILRGKVGKFVPLLVPVARPLGFAFKGYAC
jgi:splicing factor 3B subunit 1